MKAPWHKDESSEQPGDYYPEPVKKKEFPMKTIAIAAGSVFALAHIGLLGYVPVSYTHLTLPTNREV